MSAREAPLVQRLINGRGPDHRERRTANEGVLLRVGGEGDITLLADISEQARDLGDRRAVALDAAEAADRKSVV